MTSMQDNMGTVNYYYNPPGANGNYLIQYEIDRTGGRKDYVYDNYRRIQHITDNAGGSRIYRYNEFGNVDRIQDSKGDVIWYSYDSMGNKASMQDRNGRTTRYVYDGLSRLRKITDAKGVETIYDYDKIGNRTYIRDGNGNETHYEYDEFSRMTKEIFADSSYVLYKYSLEGDLLKREVYDKNGNKEKEQNFSYDNAHRLLSDGIYTYTYGAPSCSCANRVETVTDSRGTTSYEYDYKGRVKKTIYPDGTIVESIYNESAKTRTVKLDGVEVFTVGLNGEGQGVSVNEKTGGANNIFSITRDNTGRITQVLYPNKDKSITEYDVEGRIVKHKNYYKTHLINKFEYTLDNEGNKKVEKTNIGTRSYGYDEIYQLTSATYERSQAFTWQYDAAGNRTYSSMLNAQGSMSRTYAPNNLNQYVSTLNIEHGTLNNYLYDSDGNLLSDGTRTMAWDIRNRLTQVINGSKTINYKYDHNDLRMEKDIVVGTIHELSRYYYDGSLLLAEKDIDGKLQKTYINDGEGIVGFIRYIYDDSGTFSHYQRLYYLYDSLGSVSYITGENGLPLQNYTYSPYGSTLNVERDPLNGLRFVGRYGGYADDDSGLVYFWHRWYDERDGRWVSRDPVNIKGGINLYNYTENIPIKFIDENGLTCRNYWDAYSECQNSYSKCMNTLMAVGSVMTGVMGGFTCFITIHVPACPPLGAVAAAAVKVSCEIPHTIDKAAEQYCGYARNLCLQQADIDFPRR